MTRIPIDDDNADLHGHPGTDDGGDAASAQAPDAGDAEPVERRAPGGQAGGDVQKLQAERDDLYNRLARATADFKNTQKRIQTESDQRVQYANQSLIKSLLPVIDNFEGRLAMEPSKADAASILRGMQIVHDQWLGGAQAAAGRGDRAFSPARRSTRRGTRR